MRIRYFAVAAAVAIAAIAGFAIRQANAFGSPSITLSKSMPANTLYGSQTTVTLTASNPSGTNGYNLSFNEVLPAGVSLASATPAPTRVLADAPNPGQTTLIWENVSDLPPGSAFSISYTLDHSTTTYAVGASISTSAGAYLNTDPRLVPDFDPVTGVATGDYTGWDTASANTRLVPFLLTKTEPETEAELLRGLHDHQTVYTLEIQNNLVDPTNAFEVHDWVPAGMEFLGCGGVDNSSTVEYSGSGPINPGNEPAMANTCVDPSTVETVNTDPDGTGPMPTAVYTHVVWDSTALAAGFGSADLPASGTLRMDYIAAIPMNANTTTWPGGTPDPASGLQASNIDNNTGPSTEETATEQSFTNYAQALGTYTGNGIRYSDDDTTQVSSEDVSIHKSVDNGTIAQGADSTWTLLIETSEYVGNTDLGTGNANTIVVTDTVPDGLCPLGTGTNEGTSECDFAGEPEPNHPYTSATENADGTWTLVWDFDSIAGLGTMDRSETRTITFPTKTRQNYQENGSDADPVVARDSWTNTVDLTAVADGRAVNDVSSAGQSAPPLSILKEVAAPATPMTCGDGSGLTWNPNLEGTFAPGDRVCWRLTVNFPNTLDTKGTRITDFLPAGFTYDGYQPGASNTVPGAQIGYDSSGEASGVLAWDIGSAGFVDVANTLELVVSSIITDPNAARTGDLTNNLMKLSYTNTSGGVFPLRDDADAVWSEPELDLTKGVRQVNGGAVNSPPIDGVQIRGGDVVTYQVDVTNSGGRDAHTVEVWDVLPPQISCSDVSAISNAGTCNAGQDRIEWTGLSVGSGANLALTYDVTIPAGISPNQSLDNTAGVREYQSDTNLGGGDTFTYVPANNIDPTQTPNTTAADDPSNVYTGTVTINKGRTTELTETGNTSSEATIGERVDYSVTVDVPALTRVYGATLTDPLGTRYTYLGGSATGTLDGNPIAVDTTGNTITVTLPDPYTAPAGGGQLVVAYSVTVDDDAENYIGRTVSNTASFSWADQDGTPDALSDSTTTRIVEPALSITKTHSGDNVATPGELVNYTVTARNGSSTHVSTAHELTITDTLPDQISPVDAANNPVADGGTVPPDNGTWDLASRTITWTLTSLAPGASQSFTYTGQVDDPIVGSTTLTNQAAVIGSSMPGTVAGERDATSPNGGPGSGYQATTTDTIIAPYATVAKSVTPTTATIGDDLQYTVILTIPADVILYDVTTIDDLPAGIQFDGTVSSSCAAAGGGACSPDITVSEIGTVGTDTAAWFLGDLDTASTEDRVVTIVYDAHVLDIPSTGSGDTLVNTANIYGNQTDQITGTPATPPDPSGFDLSATPDTALVNIVEPRLTIDKDVNGQVGDVDWRRALAGDTLTYTLVVANTGTLAAHDVTVTDTPDSRVIPVAINDGTGYTVTDGDPSDGTLSWSIVGPIAPGGNVTITYQVQVPAGWNSAQENPAGPELTNIADVPSYFGRSTAERTATGNTYRDYDNVTADQVDIELDLASIGDRIWFDVNGDGVQDAGEYGLENVDVTITYLGANGVVGGGDDEVHVATTGPDGVYVVTDLPGGQYLIDVDETTLPTAGMTPSWDLDDGISSPDGVWIGPLGENEDKRDVDFGYTGTGSIGDTVWFDRNGDGVVDATEYGLEGIDVTVTYYGPDGTPGGGDDVVYTATTAADGTYLVSNLPAGSYLIEVDTTDLPAGMAATYDEDGGTDSIATVTLGDGENHLTADFGYNGAGSIGDTVWLDRNGDGVQDPGETGIEGVIVELTWPGEDATLGTADDEPFTTQTASDGTYLFDGLPPGQYDVTVTGGLPAFVANTFDEDGDLDSNTPVTLADGGTHLNADFGYEGTNSIGDTVWLDINGDGIQGVGESGLGGVTVQLTWAGEDGILGTADDDVFGMQTAPDGTYLFDGLPPGDYVVVVAGLPGSLTNTFDEDGDLDSSTPVTLNDGDLHLTADFGYQGNNSIGDTVWYDVTGDGIQDPGEPGIEGVDIAVTWYGPDGLPGGTDDVVYPTVTTDPAGDYLVEGLPDGNFGVQVASGVTPGFVNTFDEDGDLDQQTDVTGLSGGTLHDTADFGYTGSGAIGNTIWWDLNGDGVQDAGEPGLAAVDVALTWAGPDGSFGTADDFIQGTITGPDGTYLFDRLPDGAYRVTIDEADLPTGMTSTADPDGGITGESSLTLGAGEFNLNQDFGYAGSGSIGDTVWYDINGDGAQGPTEPGVAGVTVTVIFRGSDGLPGGGDDVAIVSTTDTDGHYSVTGLPVGQYEVVINEATLPAGLHAGSDLDGGDPASTSGGLANGEQRLDVDFGVVGDAVLTGTVWQDTDGDMTIDTDDPTESGVPGVTVNVTWSGPDGPVVITVVSDTDGRWGLTELPPGIYTVTLDEATIPAGTIPTTPTTETVDLPVGGNDNVDFGVATVVGVGSTVWMDDNGDGVIDPEEERIADVVVELLDGTGTVVATQTTDAAGQYLFDELPPGTYTVLIDGDTLPENAVAVSDRDGTLDLETTVTLVAGIQVLDANFGFQIQNVLPFTGMRPMLIAVLALLLLAVGAAAAARRPEAESI